MTELEKVITGLECCRMNGNGCKQCPYNKDCDEMPDYGNAYLCSDALELLKDQQETIASLQGTICKLNAALAEQPEQKFFVDSDGKMTPLSVQKHGHWVFDPDGMDWNIPAWKCSECHCKNDNIPPNLERTNPLRWSGSKFCPNCGAKMDEKVKQDD